MQAGKYYSYDDVIGTKYVLNEKQAWIDSLDNNTVVDRPNWESFGALIRVDTTLSESNVITIAPYTDGIYAWSLTAVTFDINGSLIFECNNDQGNSSITTADGVRFDIFYAESANSQKLILLRYNCATALTQDTRKHVIWINNATKAP